MNWENLKTVLYEIYVQENIVKDYTEDEKYLKQAFTFTEQYWNEQADKIDSVRILIFSEAPLFGNEKAYIYNPNYGFTAFFHFNDLIVVFGEKMRTDFPAIREKKKYFISMLNEAGILILDIFPFAFNPKITGNVSYQSISARLYFELFERTAAYYLLPKLFAIRSKITENTVFAVRYKKLLTKIGPLIDSALSETGLKNRSVISLNGPNMSMDRKLFAGLYPETD
jgi:hypothetical protein